MFALILVLYCTLAILIVTAIILLGKKDGKKHEKISLIATLSMSIATIAVGISTVNASKRTEVMEKNLNQPLYTVELYKSYSEEKAFYDNEEYIVTNEGAKTKIKTDVYVSSFIEIEYHDTRNSGDPIRKSIPIIYFGGARFLTYNLDGVIVYSKGSGNNNECFNNLYMDALRYEDRHTGIYVSAKIAHYFSLDYVDIYGEKHHIVKTEENEIDPDEFIKLQNEAEQNAKGEIFNINELNLDELITLLFKEK